MTLHVLRFRSGIFLIFIDSRIVNTYGAFGSVTKNRTEVILEGTWDDPRDPSAVWMEYDFNCKPGETTQRPCMISPYHYRYVIGCRGE